VGVTTEYLTHDTRITPQPPRITTFQLRRIKVSNQSKMADIDKWIDIAKECKYLPENDLKVTSSSYLSYRHAKDKQCMPEYVCNICIFIGRLIYYVSQINLDTLLFIQKLCDMVCDLLLEESNIQPVSTPVTVCGDIHGQVCI